MVTGRWGVMSVRYVKNVQSLVCFSYPGSPSSTRVAPSRHSRPPYSWLSSPSIRTTPKALDAFSVNAGHELAEVLTDPWSLFSATIPGGGTIPAGPGRQQPKTGNLTGRVRSRIRARATTSPSTCPRDGLRNRSCGATRLEAAWLWRRRVPCRSTAHSLPGHLRAAAAEAGGSHEWLVAEVWKMPKVVGDYDQLTCAVLSQHDAGVPGGLGQ